MLFGRTKWFYSLTILLSICSAGLLIQIFLFNSHKAQRDMPAPSVNAPKMKIGGGFKRPLSFEPNAGQTAEEVKFLTRGNGCNLFLTSTEAVLQLRIADSGLANEDERDLTAGQLTNFNAMPNNPQSPIRNPQSTVLRMRLVGANTSARISGLDRQPGKSNYFIGNDPEKWRTDIENYSKVKYEEVYSGIDLVYYGNQEGNQERLEYDFIVAPGASPDAIALDFDGAERLEIGEQGDLIVHTSAGEVRQKRPVAHQEENGVRVFIEADYSIKSGNEVGFQISAYDASKPLVIDPILLFSTYLGGNNSDAGSDIAVDPAGNVYVTGNTSSTNFPTANALQSSLNVSQDVFVAKFSPDGKLVYSTYLGGSSTEGFNVLGGIAVDSAGNAYVTGDTISTNFPTTPGVFQPASAGFQDVFIAKLNAAGNALVYSSYLGGIGGDAGVRVGVDGSGNACIIGSTLSGNFRTVNPLQPNNGGGQDAFVAKVNSTGSALIYSTYLGGASNDSGDRIVVDSAGNVYAGCSTNSSDFPTTANAFQPKLAGPVDAIAAKLSPDGGVLIFSTYIGGNGAEFCTGEAIDSQGNVYLTGGVNSTNFPLLNPVQTAFAGGDFDAFAVKLNSSGSALIYSTYLGGSGTEIGFGIGTDAVGNAYVAGFTNSSNFPIADPLQANNGGGNDAFAAKLSPAGNVLVYSTYLGGNGADQVNGLKADAVGNAYITGPTNSSNFPTANPAQAANGGGGNDAFVVKLSPSSVVATAVIQAVITFDSPPAGQLLPPQNVQVNASEINNTPASPIASSPEVYSVESNGERSINPQQQNSIAGFNVFRVAAPPDGQPPPSADAITGDPRNLVAVLPPDARMFVDKLPNGNFIYSLTSFFGNGMQSSGSPPAGTNLPVIKSPMFVKGTIFISAPGSFIKEGAMLIVNNSESYPLQFDATGVLFTVPKKTKGMPGNLTIKKAIKKNTTVRLTVKNTDGKTSVGVTFTRAK